MVRGGVGHSVPNSWDILYQGLPISPSQQPIYPPKWWDILSPIDEIFCTQDARIFCPKVVGHFVPRWWDILYQGGGTFCTKVYPFHLASSLLACKEKTSPIYIFPIWVFLLNGAAQSPRPLLRFTPGYAAVRRRNDLATARTAEGNPSRGVPPDPLPPFAHKGL